MLFRSAAIAHLLRSISATHVLVSSDRKTRALVEATLASWGEDSADGLQPVPKILDMPCFEDLYSTEEVEFLPGREYDYVAPALYVHSSGMFCRNTT